jgi:hypothetical protein
LIGTPVLATPRPRQTQPIKALHFPTYFFRRRRTAELVNLFDHLVGSCDVSGLALSTASPVDVTSGKAGIIGRKLDIDRGEFRWLSGPTEDGRAAELLILPADLLSRMLPIVTEMPQRNKKYGAMKVS